VVREKGEEKRERNCALGALGDYPPRAVGRMKGGRGGEKGERRTKEGHGPDRLI
jgi:hypothetical protein